VNEPRDAPYPELKKQHTMARTGRPWTDTKPPQAAPVWAAIEGLGRYHSLVAAIDLGVFDALGSTGPVTAEALAAELAVSGPHLRSLLDAVVAMGLLDQWRGVYELNDTARRYLATDGPACMAALVPVAPGPHENWHRLADTVRDGRPAAPIDLDPAAFYVPLVEATFATMLRCATRADRSIRYSARPSTRVLDLGAGGAPWSIAVLAACPEGRAVVNDLPGVLDVAARRAAEHGVADRCELRPGDFHTVAIEPGAYDLVVLGHVCRAEGAERSRRLLARAFDALAPGGRLLLADYFVGPERRTTPHAVLMGTTMAASTLRGATFTYEDMSGWLRDAGFARIRLVEPIGFQQVFVATRPEDGVG
jgi:SAM-dependent methyltransferase